MSKSLVGRVENQKFAFFWLLIGGGIVNILIILRSPASWPIFLPSTILSLLMTMTMVHKKKRPKVWLGIDLLLTFISLIFGVSFFGMTGIDLAVFLSGILIIFGCILGIMDW
jgi:hypothetical protein